MLQILEKMRGATSKMLPNTMEIAASSSKMLQIARGTDRTGDPPKKTETGKETKQYRTPLKLGCLRASQKLSGEGSSRPLRALGC